MGEKMMRFGVWYFLSWLIVTPTGGPFSPLTMGQPNPEAMNLPIIRFK